MGTPLVNSGWSTGERQYSHPIFQGPFRQGPFRQGQTSTGRRMKTRRPATLRLSEVRRPAENGLPAGFVAGLARIRLVASRLNSCKSSYG